MAKKKSKSKTASKKKAKKKPTKKARKSPSNVDAVAETPGVYETSDYVPDPEPIGDVTKPLNAFEATAEKVRAFPQLPGVYLMKDSAGVVIYVGKATNLRSRAGSYFLKAASEEARTADWVPLIADADFIECDSEVDALLVESRLIKDIQPAHNKILKDDKTFPSPAPVRCAGPCKCCSGSLNSALVRWISKKATSAGNGIALACWPASNNVRLPAICGSRKRTIGKTFVGFNKCWLETRRSCYAK